MILLHLPANPTASIACDMSSAPDAPEERIAEYRRLFEHAFAGRQRESLSVALSFHDRPGLAEWVQNLARREAACCPFVDYRVERRDAHVVWTISGSDDPAVQTVVALWHDLSEMLDAPLALRRIGDALLA